MADLKNRLRLLDNLDVPDNWREVESRQARGEGMATPPRRRTLVVAVVTIGLTVGGVLFLGTLFSPPAPDDLIPSPRSPLASPSVGATLELDGCPLALAAGEGAAWVSLGCQGNDPGPGELVRVESSTGAIEGIYPRALGPLVVAFGSLWAADGATVLRIDPDTGDVLATIPLSQGPSALSADDEAVWVLSSHKDSESLERIDAATNRVVANVPITGDLPEAASDHRFTLDFEVGEGSAWVLSLGISQGGGISDGFVLRVEPETGRISGVVPVGYSLDLTVGEGAVWAAHKREGGVRVDATTLHVDSLNLADFEPFAVGDGGVWFLDRGGPGVAVSRLDPETLQVNASVPEPSYPSTVDLEPVYDPSSHTIWIPSDDEYNITRVDLR